MVGAIPYFMKRGETRWKLMSNLKLEIAIDRLGGIPRGETALRQRCREVIESIPNKDPLEIREVLTVLGLLPDEDYMYE